jgi:hypothetical protein
VARRHALLLLGERQLRGKENPTTFTPDVMKQAGSPHDGAPRWRRWLAVTCTLLLAA